MRRFGRYLIGTLLVVAIAVVAIVLFAARSVKPAPVTVDLTRHLSTHVVAQAAAVKDLDFAAVPGEAQILVRCEPSVDSLEIALNGTIAYQHTAASDCNESTVASVTLGAQNQLQVTIEGASQAQATVRVKQRAEVQLNVLSRVHFNANVSDFAASREFYGQLGFTTLSGFPDTNTLAMARAIGIKTPTTYDGSSGDHAGGYLLHGELISLGLAGGVIDLIEFTIPRDEAPPYGRMNHLGMAYSVMVSNDLPADYQRLVHLGVRFITPPTTRASGEQFAVFQDPDGILYELRQGSAPASATEAGASHISALGPLGVNVSDFERSAAWYAMFGYQLEQELSATEDLEVAAAMGLEQGLEQPIRRRGARLSHAIDRSTMELVQWLEPFDPQPPYPIPVNHIGIHRTALVTRDIEADVAVLKQQGVQFVSEITPCCSGPDSSGSIVAFYDPDGVIVELVEQPLMTWMTPVMIWAGNTFGGS